MAEQRLIDANAVIEKLQEAVTHKGMGAAIAGVLIRYIETIPTVDAVEVVRCEDCKHYGTSGCAMDAFSFDVTEESFCSYGERRTDGKAD